MNIPQLNRSTYPQAKTYPVKILQFGEGNFLRAFVDWMIFRMNQTGKMQAGIAVVQPIAQGMTDRLNDQDGLYTLYLRGIVDGEPRSDRMVVDAIQNGINPYTNYADFLATARLPEMEFVISNTTEAGIAFVESDQYTDTPPASFPAKLTVWLHHRYVHFKGDASKGLFVIPCELIDKNADYLKKYVLQYADLWQLGDDFKQWILQHNQFCNSLVDRIVPGYPRDRMEEVQQELPYHDQLVNEAEQFHLWVIEGDERLKKRFPVAEAGLQVLIVPDASDYKTRKVRILNGAHTALCPIGILAGIPTVRESMEDKDTMKFLESALQQEIIPTLTLPKQELDQFAADVLDRFRNPFIKHYWMSISLNSMSKFETRVLPSLLACTQQSGKLPAHLCFSLAALISMYQPTHFQQGMKDNDDIVELFAAAWGQFKGAQEDYTEVVKTVLGYTPNWKMDLNQIPGLAREVVGYLTQIEQDGMRAALQKFNQIHS